VSLDAFVPEFQAAFDAKMAARERALPAARRAIRASANAIRAIHRQEFERAHGLQAEARAALDEGFEATTEHPDIRNAGFLHDAAKEYAEAIITEAVVTGADIPGPDEMGVEIPAWLNGLSEAIGEARRFILDLLRRGEHARGEELLATMDDMYALLVTMDYPDALTGNLRRSTDVARSILERTRGDLTMSIVQEDLREALERHARGVDG
jgi:translin